MIFPRILGASMTICGAVLSLAMLATLVRPSLFGVQFALAICLLVTILGGLGCGALLSEGLAGADPGRGSRSVP